MFPKSMANDLVETQLGLRTEEMQSNSTMLLERIISYVHVIQLCVDNAPPKGSAPEDFPLVVMSMQEFMDIDFDADIDLDSTTTMVTPKKKTLQEEIDEALDSVDQETVKAQPGDLKQDAKSDFAELQKMLQTFAANIETRFDAD